MTIGMSDVVVCLTLIAISALAWRRKRNADGKTWAFRIVPLGLIILRNSHGSATFFLWGTLGLLAAYAVTAYKGGWRPSRHKNRILYGVSWAAHILVYFTTTFFFGVLVAGIVGAAVKFSPIATEGDWPWTKGKITDQLPFAVEYRRLKTLCPEYDKRLLFKSGKRVGLLSDPCGFGPFLVYRLKSGEYCLVDGFDQKLPESFGDVSRWLRVNVTNETVELRLGTNWFRIPEEGYVCGWAGGEDLLVFTMYAGGDLGKEEWDVVAASSTPVGNSLDGKQLIGTIDTSGRFKHLRQSTGANE
ncbi:MAG: hypothetical protein IJ829_04510 [Kiritimatiellae bacterium]|nr:hypothetical protein [Kiritimatiellia bacterium]